jgi:uncharacterized protein (TIGR00251 family)
MADKQKKTQPELIPVCNIAVKITPRSSKNEIIEIMDDGTIKVRLTACPVDGKANHDLLVFLSETLGISYTNIYILTGKTTRTKLISIKGLDQFQVNERIKKVIKPK